MGSIPVRVTKNKRTPKGVLLFLPIRPEPTQRVEHAHGFVFEPKAVWELARKRLGENFSLKASFPYIKDTKRGAFHKAGFTCR